MVTRRGCSERASDFLTLFFGKKSEIPCTFFLNNPPTGVCDISAFSLFVFCVSRAQTISSNKSIIFVAGRASFVFLSCFSFAFLSLDDEKQKKKYFCGLMLDGLGLNDVYNLRQHSH